MLVVEDHPDIAAPLVRTLQREGYRVSSAETGQAGLDAVATGDVDLVILDLGLPDMDGLDVCRHLREGGFGGGIIICTARGDELDKVVGLDLGADDYLPKPFSLAELQARVRALLRRAGAPAGESADPEVPSTALRLDRSARRVTVGAAEVALTAKEYDVLALLSERPGAVVARERLMSEVWDENWFGSTKTLDVTVGRLRQKLADAGAGSEVVNVRGIGFRLEHR